MGLYQLAILKEWNKIHVDEFKELFSFIEESIKKPEKNSSKRFQGLIKDMSESEKEEFLTFYEDEFLQYSRYRRSLNNSFLITIFSYLESAMNGICRNIGKIKEGEGIKIRLEDINGASIERAKVYLTKVAGCNDSLFTSSIWQDIKTLQYIRNAIVHNESNIPRGDKGEALKKYIANRPDYFTHENIALDLETYYNHIPILPKREYCMFSLESIEKFLEQLLHDIRWE